MYFKVLNYPSFIRSYRTSNVNEYNNKNTQNILLFDFKKERLFDCEMHKISKLTEK